MKATLILIPLLLVTTMTATLGFDTIQVDVHKLLNARVIVTFSKGTISPVMNGGIGAQYGGPEAVRAQAWVTNSSSTVHLSYVPGRRHHP